MIDLKNNHFDFTKYLELCRNSTKISCKIQGVNLKMEWGEQDQ